jgi:hypothetical protein
MWRWKHTTNQWVLAAGDRFPTPLCPITSQGVPDAGRVVLIDAGGNLTYYDAAALYQWFTTSIDFRCPITRRLLLLHEVRRCALAITGNSHTKQSLADYVRALYLNRLNHLRQTQRIADDVASRRAVMEEHIREAMSLVRSDAGRTECDREFLCWREAYHRLREVDAFAAGTAVIDVIDRFTQNHEANRRSHEAEYGYQGTRLVAYHLTIALNIVVRNNGVPPSRTLTRLIRLNNHYAPVSLSRRRRVEGLVAARRLSIQPYRIGGPTGSVAVVDLTEDVVRTDTTQSV